MFCSYQDPVHSGGAGDGVIVSLCHSKAQEGNPYESRFEMTRSAEEEETKENDTIYYRRDTRKSSHVRKCQAFGTWHGPYITYKPHTMYPK